MPLLDQNTQTLCLMILAGAVILLIVLVLYLHVRLSRVLRGKSGADLEASINHLSEHILALEKFEKDSKDYFLGLEKRVKRASQGIETVRFNAFKGDGMGGNQSFATAIVNENGDGVVFSSLYSRERVSVFSKPVQKFASEIELTEEEKQALEGAKSKVRDRK